MTLLRLLAAFFCSLLAIQVAHADGLAHLWSQSFGDASDQRAASIVVDGDGNILIAGSFRGAIDFGGGTLVSAGGNDIYLAKFDANGNHIWSRSYGDGQHQFAFGLAVNSLGQPVLAGSFRGAVNFGGGNHVSAGGYDIYVAKFDANGYHLWSRSYGDEQDQYGTGVGVDSGGMVGVTGYFEGTVDFGGGPLTSAGGTDIFLFRLDSSSGYHMWSKRFGDASDQGATDLATHIQGRIVITGRAYGTVDFGGGPLTSAGGSDTFIALFRPWGDHQWSRLVGGVQHDVGYGVDFSLLTDAVVVTGFFAATAYFGGAPLTAVGGIDVFLAKYDIDGNHVWSCGFGGEENEYPRDVAVRNWGEIAFTGYFEGTADFGGGPLTSAGQSDIIIATYDANCNHLTSQRAGDANRQEGEGAAYTDGGQVVALGHFEGAIDLGGAPLTSNGSFDIYLAKLGPIPTGVETIPTGSAFDLRIHPNPAGRAPQISYTLPRAGWVSLQVYAIEGRLIDTLANELQPAGHHVVTWENQDAGKQVRQIGARFVRLRFEGEERTEKVLLVD